MDVYIETKRDRRIRDFRRMVRHAYRVIWIHRWLDGPDQPYMIDPPQTWSEVFGHRWRLARFGANNLKERSCTMCGNPRRHYGDRTRQEMKRYLADIEQFIEEGYLDDSVVQRRPKRGGVR